MLNLFNAYHGLTYQLTRRRLTDGQKLEQTDLDWHRNTLSTGRMQNFFEA
jgi:hypothetical protein